MSSKAWLRVAGWALLPAVLSAQTAPSTPGMLPESEAPAAVAQALRERVTVFFGYHVGGVNRRAIDLVAEDTKDYYFSSGKVQFEDFRLTKLEFDPSFEKAVAWINADREWNLQGQRAVADTLLATTWKIEDGKWVWYLDTQGMWTTPMGPSDFSATAANQAKRAELLKQNSDGTINLPPDFSDPTKVLATAQAILQQSKLDKNEVQFQVNTPSEETISFLNGYGGDVSLELGGTPEVAGLKVTLEKPNLRPKENGVIRLSYTPPAELAGKDTADRFIPTQQYVLRVTIQPFNQEFPVRLIINGSIK